MIVWILSTVSSKLSPNGPLVKALAIRFTVPLDNTAFVGFLLNMAETQWIEYPFLFFHLKLIAFCSFQTLATHIPVPSKLSVVGPSSPLCVSGSIVFISIIIFDFDSSIYPKFQLNFHEQHTNNTSIIFIMSWKQVPILARWQGSISIYMSEWIVFCMSGPCMLQVFLIWLPLIFMISVAVLHHFIAFSATEVATLSLISLSTIDVFFSLANGTLIFTTHIL